jgi:hypothetical protein
MPKLGNDEAREAEEAAEKDRPEPLPEGIYAARLHNVEVSADPGKSGFHYWTWEWIVQDDGYKGRHLFLQTSLSPKARFAIGGVFAAMGVAADTHTDELLGRHAMLRVDVQPIEGGSRKGELANRVLRATPYEGEETPFDPPSGNGGNPAHDEDF